MSIVNTELQWIVKKTHMKSCGEGDYGQFFLQGDGHDCIFPFPEFTVGGCGGVWFVEVDGGTPFVFMTTGGVVCVVVDVEDPFFEIHATTPNGRHRIARSAIIAAPTSIATTAIPKKCRI